MSDVDLYINIGVLLVLLYCSSFFSSSETAIMAINIARLRQMEEEGNKENIDRLKNVIKTKLNDILITMLLGNNIVNIAATAIATQLIGKLVTGSNGVLLATLIMTLLILIFGEITPKSYAAKNAEKIALRNIRVLEFLNFIFKPVLAALTVVSNFIIRLRGGDPVGATTFVTEEEIMSLVDVGEEEGVVKHQEREMIEGVFEMDEAEVSEIMIPRIDIVAVELGTTLKEVMDIIVEKGHSRIPVFKESIDNIIGVVYAKDLLKAAILGSNEFESKTVDGMLREAYFVPEGKKLNKLLKELQTKKVHMAIILDEYGGTEGLITIEDILEEIVGEIFDEYDYEVMMIEKLNDQKYIVQGEIGLDEMEDFFTVEFTEEEKEDYDSIGGYIFNTIDRVPKNGDMIEYNGLKLTVKKVIKRRIKEILVEIIDDTIIKDMEENLSKEIEHE